jgi:hypothetical protein
VHDPPPGGQSGRGQKIIGASCDLGGSERGSTAGDQTALRGPVSIVLTRRILLAIPCGLAGVAAGLALVRQSNSAAALSQ